MMVKDHEKLSALSHEHAIFNANLVHAFFPLPRYTTAALIQDANHSIYFSDIIHILLLLSISKIII